MNKLRAAGLATILAATATQACEQKNGALAEYYTCKDPETYQIVKYGLRGEVVHCVFEVQWMGPPKFLAADIKHPEDSQQDYSCQRSDPLCSQIQNNCTTMWRRKHE